MRFLRAKHGQSMAEYAILFAIVIGAAIAMQQYVKSRLQGAVHGAANAYTAAVTGGNINALAFEPARTVNTSSNQSDFLSMTSASAGNRTQNIVSNTKSTVTK